MLRSAFIAFFRSFTRHPLYALLNLLGLSFGIAAFITLSLLYHFETSYESWSPERSRIYAMGERIHIPGFPDDLNLWTHGSMLDEVRLAWPQVEGTREMLRTVSVKHAGLKSDEQMALVDGNFLSFFQAPVVRGNAADAFADPARIAVSATVARKYFGTIDAIGKVLTVTDDQSQTGDYTISAVIADLPETASSSSISWRRFPPQRMTARRSGPIGTP